MNTSITPESVTFEHIRAWDGQEMKNQMARSPEMREAIYAIIRTKSLVDIEAAQAEMNARTVADNPPAEQTPEELAAAEAQRIQAEQAETLRIAAEQEAARKAAEPPKKIVLDYQVKDEDGNPIGRPTHLEALTEDEMRGKIIEAHVQATRAFHRLKKQKISFKDQQPIVVPKSDEDLLAAMKDLRSDDPQKQLEAIRKVQKAESDKIQAEQAETARQAAVSRRFLGNHKEDFYNCKANIDLVKEYFLENPELTWTDDNLEICFHALEHKLAPVPQPEPVPPTPPANPVVAVVPVVPVAVQPQVATPAQAVAPANPAPTVHRPGVNGGLEPGQSSGTRPAVTTQSKGPSEEEMRAWDGPTMRAKMRDPRVRPYIDAWVDKLNKRQQAQQR